MVPPVRNVSKQSSTYILFSTAFEVKNMLSFMSFHHYDMILSPITYKWRDISSDLRYAVKYTLSTPLIFYIGFEVKNMILSEDACHAVAVVCKNLTLDEATNE
jgi:hypothetical protein